jgi:lysophospholipase L1-like esterase
VNRQRRLGFVLGFLTAATCVLILEGGLRFQDWQHSGKPREAATELSLLQENPAGTGSYRLRPNLDLETQVGTSRIRIKTNAHGMAWRETPLKGDPSRQRVAFLGDSFTFGCWAADSSRSFVGVFEKSLPADRFEALNFGVGGYGLPDEELLLKELALRFGPSYVIVVSYMGNDFPDAWLGLDKENIVNGTAQRNPEVVKARVPAEYLAPDDRGPLPCPEPWWRRLAEGSAAFRRLEPLLDLEDPCVRFRPNRSFFRPAFWSSLPVPEVALQARDVVLETLSRMDTVTTAHQARLAVVALPTAAQVYAVEHSGRNFDTALPQAYLQNFCRDRRIPYLDLLPLLRRQAASSNRRLYFKRDIHLTDFGHARVGELIAAWFDSRVRR